MSNDKKFEGYIVIDWKNNDFKALKTKPDTTPYQLVVEFEINVEIPEVSVKSISKDLRVDEADIKDVIMEEVSFEEDSVFGLYYPDEDVETTEPIETYNELEAARENFFSSDKKASNYKLVDHQTGEEKDLPVRFE